MILTRDGILKAADISSVLSDGEIQEFAESTARAANTMASLALLALSRFREPVLELPEITPVFSELNDKLDRIEKKESETELESKVIIRSKPRKAGYDAAFEKMINEKISYKQAYEFWKENFPDEYEALATKQDGINNTFDAFKSAMKYRKNKGMGE